MCVSPANDQFRIMSLAVALHANTILFELSSPLWAAVKGVGKRTFTRTAVGAEVKLPDRNLAIATACKAGAMHGVFASLWNYIDLD